MINPANYKKVKCNKEENLIASITLIKLLKKHQNNKLSNKKQRKIVITMSFWTN